MIIILIGPSGNGKTRTAVALLINYCSAMCQRDENHAIYSNIPIYTPQPNQTTPNLIHSFQPITSIQTMKEISHAHALVDEMWLYGDSRRFAEEQNIAISRMAANVRKRHTTLIVTAQDPESIDKRIRFNAVNNWIAPIPVPQRDTTILAYYRTEQQYMKDFLADQIPENAYNFNVIQNASTYNQYYDTDLPLDVHREPYPIQDTTQKYQAFLQTNNLKPSRETLAEWITEANILPPTNLQQNAILSRTKRLTSNITT